MPAPAGGQPPARLRPRPTLLAWRGWLCELAWSHPAKDRSVRIAAGLTLLSAGWFAVGPGRFQLLGIRAVVPALAGMTAAGLWQLGADRRLPAAAARFWLLLSIALFIFTAGMVVDFAVEVGALVSVNRSSAGEVLLFPIAGLFAIVALVVYPTALRSPLDRLKFGLDIAIVLFGCAAFVWFFMGSQLWSPGQEVGLLANRLVLPALTLLAGFAVLRITLAGANVICRRAMVCFVSAASTATASILMVFGPETVGGRIGSMLQVLALAACVLGVAIQRGEAATAGSAAVAARPGWRRPLHVLPYFVLAATSGLLLSLIAEDLDYRGWVVAIAVLVLSAAVSLRQLAALWENTRLLAGNEELTGELRHQAFHDHLTGLVNRALFTERVGAAIARTRPVGWSGGGEVAVLFVDLDDFKIVNDSLGHHVGDELLVAVAERLRACIGPRDTLCRLGGDEFAILLVDTDADAAAELARAVVAALDRPMRPAGIQVRIAASIGVAVAVAGEPGVVELLRNADVAMYTAKHAGNGRWRVFEPPMLTGLLHRQGRRAALSQAVERDEFEVHYQPIVDLVRGTAVGAEALVRWRVDGELIRPGDFVPLAEETGLITDIDRTVLARACEQAAGWRARLGDEFDLHVNVSARLLHRADLIADVRRALRSSGLPARQLTLEVTEPGLSHEEAAVGERLRELRRLGVRIAIDDFGTGRSSLSHLRAISADIIKIDKVFVDDLADGQQPCPIAKALVALAANLGISTIAEGVERAEQVDALVSLGCTRGQGYHLGRPMSAAALTAWLTRSADVQHPQVVHQG